MYSSLCVIDDTMAPDRAAEALSIMGMAAHSAGYGHEGWVWTPARMTVRRLQHVRRHADYLTICGEMVFYCRLVLLVHEGFVVFPLDVMRLCLGGPSIA